MRRAFSNALFEAAGLDPRLIFLTGDLGFQVFDEFQSRYGPRYINVGVAEAQLINCAAGLATVGWRPVAYSIASFASARPFEQIRFSVCYPNLPVTVVGAGRGLTYSTSGVSHHALDDIGLMSLLPNMTVVIPGDPSEVEQLFRQTVQLPGPAYFTVGRFGEPRLPAEEPAQLGKARLLKHGERIAILSTGEIAHEVIQALSILQLEGIHPRAYQFHTIKPLDTVALDNLYNELETLIVVEEHVPQGGLWSAVLQWAAGKDSPPRLKRIGAPDSFVLGNLKREEARRRLGLDAANIANVCRDLWRHSRMPRDPAKSSIPDR